MNNKKWYTSKTIIASIITFAISVLEVAEASIIAGQLDETAIMTLVTSIIAIYGRITATDMIE
jgi:hypothetical protein